MALKTTICSALRELAGKSSQRELGDFIMEVKGGDYGELESDVLEILESKWEGPPSDKSFTVQILDHHGRPYCELGVLGGSTMKEVHDDVFKMVRSGLMGRAMDIDTNFVLMKGDTLPSDDAKAAFCLRCHKDRRLTIMPTKDAKWYLHNPEKSLPRFIYNGLTVVYVPEITTTVAAARKTLTDQFKVSLDRFHIIDQNMFPLPEATLLWRHWVRQQPREYTITINRDTLPLPSEKT